MRFWVLLGAALFGCDAPIARSLSEAEALELREALAQRGVPTTMTAGARGRTVSVPVGQVAEAVDALRQTHVFSEEGTSSSAGGLVPSPFQERARLHAGLVRELTETLVAHPHVREARVHLALAGDRPRFRLESDAPETGAVVFLVAPEDRPPDRFVRALVHGSVPEVPEERVRILRIPNTRERPAVQPLTTVGPIVVAETSAGLLRTLAILAVLLHGTLAAGLLWTVARRRRTEPSGSER